ncbi:hypothetical protein DGG96_13925 [Legionella qingyii]|uniref:Uncharacterized protein n=1 Tax=Legionella qingyii TaxID=2184757 RepID=A0A317U2H9_9GAMM|nr:hypothetical protein [Legionella qingyii]PWY55007.1 hypothetical protein DGG96_13925 [Legionella qingyii]RUR26388.1 hypothetical protein ELY20_00235 [Legionella qingyii]RUR27409.1 hypothetical protein ELY16_04580 [Legionella qingyii]
MPNFLIKTADTLLLDVPRGKRYVGEPDILRAQPAQKGGTCALYALNPLRFRFGKNDRDPEHGKERFIELVFSEYRRGLNKIEFDKNTAKLLSEEFDDFIAEQKDKNITQEVIKNFIKKLEADMEDLKFLSMDTSKIKQQIETYIEFCNDYIKKYNQYDDFEEYLNKREYVDCVALAEKTLDRLKHITGFDAEIAIQNHLELCIKSVVKSHENYCDNIQLNKDNPELMAPFYHQAVVRLAASCYQLEGSEWDPSKPIDGLMEILQEYGPMVIYTAPSVVFIPGICTIESSTDKYQIHTKKQGPQKTIEGSHSLLIVGAERGKETDYVYLMDPNVPAPLTGPCQFYKITYKELLDNLVNIYGVSIKEDADKIIGPFAFQAKKGNFDRIFQFVEGSVKYEKLANTKKTSIDLFLEEIVQQTEEKLAKKT